jgi:hypothetical protein
MAAPSAPLIVQLPQVRSSAAANAVPSGCVPVRMSCRFGVSPQPLTTAPLLGDRALLVEIVVALQLGDVLRDHHAVRVLPRSLSDPVAGVDRALAARRLRAR